MSVVVTGANGHVGSNLVRRLLERGKQVRCLVHRNHDALDELDVQQVRGSVNDPASLRAAFRGADTVHHLAARISIVGDKDGSVHATNVVGAKATAQAALDMGVRRFVHMSSVHAFDLHCPGPITESSPRSGPKNYAYDRSKAAGEAGVREVIQQGLDATFVNPTGIIGPHDYAPSRMGKVFLDLAHGRLPALVRGGFDFVDVRDVCDGAMAAAERGQTGENHLLGGAFIEVPELARIAAKVTGMTAPRLALPPWLARAGVPFAAMQARGTGREPEFTAESIGALRHGKRVDCSKAAKELGYRPRPIRDSVQAVYDDFARRGWWEAA